MPGCMLCNTKNRKWRKIKLLVYFFLAFSTKTQYTRCSKILRKGGFDWRRIFFRRRSLLFLRVLIEIK